MIFSSIHHFEQERLLFPRAVQRGIDYIRSRNLAQAEPGKYELEGELMFASVQEIVTRPSLERRPESHVSYTDIQYLVSGEEKMGVFKLHSDIQVLENKFDTHDIAFYDSEENPYESEIILRPGMYAVFFPSDVHRPCCSVSDDIPIKKVVIKIHQSLL